MKDSRRAIPTPGWLRPAIRWSSRFSLNSPEWLPQAVRKMPLKLSALVLRSYYLLVK
jgi:hypothetical protein